MKIRHYLLTLTLHTSSFYSILYLYLYLLCNLCMYFFFNLVTEVLVLGLLRTYKKHFTVMRVWLCMWKFWISLLMKDTVILNCIYL